MVAAAGAGRGAANASSARCRASAAAATTVRCRGRPARTCRPRRVVHRAAALLDDRDRRRVGHRRAIGPIRGQGVEAVDHRENARADRNLLAAQAARIPAAVPVLVMGAHDRHDRVGEVDRRRGCRRRRRRATSSSRTRAAVSVPGLLRMCSGTASLPVSCSSAAASIACSVGWSVIPSARASPIA